MTDLHNKESFLAQVDVAIERLMRKKALSATHVADSLNMHPQKLQRYMKLLAGVGSSEYIQHYRVEYAKQLLLTHDILTVASIGYQCGFDEPTHFTRFFKRLTGITPMEFRKIEKHETEKP